VNKLLIIITGLSLSLSSYAYDICSLDNPELHSFDDEVISYGIADLNKNEFEQIIGIRKFDYNTCKDSISLATVNLGGDIFALYYTNEDKCDGGNSYGSVLNSKGDIIAAIADGAVYCE
jgi:hypothetical protein